jgi:YwiC-like protein
MTTPSTQDNAGSTAPPAAPVADRTRPRRPARRWRRFVPIQHGAWPMLAVPYLAGLIAAGFRWADLPLLAAGIAGYPLSYFLLLAVKSRRPGRYRDQLVVYAAAAVLSVALVVLARPQVLLYAPAYVALFAVNVWYAGRRQERALVNDAASVGQSCLIVFVVATIADAPLGPVLPVFALCLAYFLGTAFYVKTMIRERDNRAYRWLSIGYHALALAVVAWLTPWAAALFAWLLARAAVLPRRALRPKTVGLLELVNCVLLLLCVRLTG